MKIHVAFRTISLQVLIGCISMSEVFSQVAPIWAFGGNSTSDSYGFSVAFDNEQNIYLAGGFGDNINIGGLDLNAEPFESVLHQAFLVKLNSEGEGVWIREFGSPDWDYGQSIEIVGDHIYLAMMKGYNNTELFKLTLDGSLIWSREVGGAYHWEEVSDVLEYLDGRIFLSTPTMVYVFDGDGNPLSPISQSNSFVSVGNDGFIAAIDTQQRRVNHYQSGVINEQGSLIWQGDFLLPTGITQITSVAQYETELYFTGSFDGNLVINQTSLFEQNYVENIFFIKTSRNGEIIWVNQAGGTDQDIGRAILISETNRLFVTGQFRNEAFFGNKSFGGISRFNQIFLAELDVSDGEFIQVIEGGGVDDDFGYAIASNSTDNLILTGGTELRFGINIGDLFIEPINNGNSEVFMAKFGKPELIANINGAIMRQGVPEFGTVRLYQLLDNDKYRVVNSTPSNNDKSFDLTLFRPGTYLLRALYTDDSEGQFIGAYYPSIFHWADATSIEIKSDTILNDININLIQLPQSNGSNRVSGTIYTADTLQGRFMDIYLVSTEGIPFQYVRSDTLGNYEIRNIPNDNFTIYLDTAGLNLLSYHSVSFGTSIAARVSTAENSSTHKSARNYMLTDQGILAIDYFLIRDTKKAVTVFPNPTKGIVRFYFEDSSTDDVKVTVFDSKGRAIIRDSPVSNELDLSYLVDGSYFIRLYSKEFSITRKIIIQR